MDIVTKEVAAAVAPVESAHPSGEFDVVLSTAALDRDGEQLHTDEWKLPLPEHITFDSDHGMSVATTVGSGRPFINDAGQLQVRGVFASTPHAQTVRTLVNEGHITTTSVAFRARKNVEGVTVSRELLNGAFVAVPANPEAIVLSAKADKKPYGDVAYADPKNGKYPIDTEAHVRAAWSYINMPKNAAQYSADELSKVKARIRSAAKRFGIEISDDSKSLDEVFTKAAASSATSMTDMLQAIHDAAVHLGAMCSDAEEQTEPSDNPKEERAEKRFTPHTSSRPAGPPMESTDESAADTAAAAKAAAAVNAADESAESVALRGRALALTLGVKTLGDSTAKEK